MSTQNPAPATEEQIVERVLLDGDLSRLDDRQRLAYYARVCESLKLNPLTKPFDFLRLSGRLILYARKDCTDQLRHRHGITIVEVTDEQRGDIYLVRVRARDKDGREDIDVGAVSIAGLKAEPLANAYMRCLTKAKRRTTLALAGLGLLDESELLDTVTEHSTAPAPSSSAIPASPAKAAPTQLQEIYRLWTGKHRLDREVLSRWIHARYCVDRGRELTEAQAAEALRLLTEINTAELVSQFTKGPTPLELAAQAANMNMAEVPDLAHEMFGVFDLTQLTHDQLDELIDELSGRAQTSEESTP